MKKIPYSPCDFDFYFLKYFIQSEWALERARGEAAKKWNELQYVTFSINCTQNYYHNNKIPQKTWNTLKKPETHSKNPE